MGLVTVMVRRGRRRDASALLVPMATRAGVDAMIECCCEVISVTRFECKAKPVTGLGAQGTRPMPTTWLGKNPRKKC